MMVKSIYSSKLFSFILQVALKRQQAVEDAIALRLASTEMGTQLETLPPGKIYGMTVTEPCASPQLGSPSSMDISSSTSPACSDKEPDPVGSSKIQSKSFSMYQHRWDEYRLSGDWPVQLGHLSSVTVDFVDLS